MLGPVRLPRPAPTPALACGAFLKNSACLVDGRQVAWSPLHGDLRDGDACRALARSARSLLDASTTSPRVVAHDLHPDFHSTHLAQDLAAELGLPSLPVQHHHAHVAAVIAEAGLTEPVIGVALDGVGLGNDGTAWGGEILWVDGGQRAHRWRRLGHLPPLRMAGGDAAAREPWRLAAALLHELGRGDEIAPRFGSTVGDAAARGLQAMLGQGLNCPSTSAAGRWFDAAAGALGLCLQQQTEAEAAIALERCATRWLQAHPDFDQPWPSLDLRPVVARLLDVAPDDDDALARGAASFHLALCSGLAHAVIDAAAHHGTGLVVLGGGCFVNRVLRERLTAALQRAGLEVHTAQAASCGDAGLALGQAWVAACAVAAGQAAVGRATEAVA